MARAVPLPMATASVRIRFSRSVGAKGLPFWMPTDAKSPRSSGSSMPIGSRSMTVCSSS